MSDQTSQAYEELRKRDREMIPSVLLRAMLFLVVAVLVIVAFARITDRPLEATRPDTVPVAAERMIEITADMSGSAIVRTSDGSLIADLSPEQGGFIAGVGRVLARERGKLGLSAEGAVRLVRYADGHLSLYDPLTGWSMQIAGFGADNTAAFAALLEE